MIWPALAHGAALSITHELAVLMKPTAVGAGPIPRLALVYGNPDPQSTERPLVPRQATFARPGCWPGRSWRFAC
jgi:hypothetical protein